MGQSHAKGVDRLAQALVHLGVDVAFGLPGVHNLPIWEAFEALGIRIIGVRHEQTAAYAADGYSRATGKLGVALVTTGPGAANAIGATGEAFTVGSRILVMATDIDTAIRRPGVFRGALHECKDQTGMFEPVTKATWYATEADKLGEDTLAAGREALAAPSGPVYLGVPLDVLNGAAPTILDLSEPERTNIELTSSELHSAATKINKATNPLIWAGGGAVAAGCGGNVARLAELIAAPIMTTYGAKGLVSYEHPNVLVSPPQVPLSEALWNEADLVIAIGSDFDAMMTKSWGMQQPRQLLAINVNPADASKNYATDQVLCGDANVVLEQLLPSISDSGRNEGIVARVAEIDRQVWADAENECADATNFLDIIRNTLPPNANIVADMCVAGYWSGGFCRVPEPRKLAYPVGWGTLGFALPASIGTATADTGPTVVIAGDGGFLYAPGELATIMQEDIPLTIVVIDDGGYGMLKFAQDYAGLPNQGVDLHTPDFAQLAESFGLDARSVIGLGDDFALALKEGIASGRPNLIWAKARLLPPPNTSTRSATTKAGHA